jgi:hypothetical protein
LYEIFVEMKLAAYNRDLANASTTFSTTGIADLPFVGCFAKPIEPCSRADS